MKRVFLLLIFLVVVLCMTGCFEFVRLPKSNDDVSPVYEFTPVEPVTDGGNYSVIRN